MALGCNGTIYVTERSPARFRLGGEGPLFFPPKFSILIYYPLGLDTIYGVLVPRYWGIQPNCYLWSLSPSSCHSHRWLTSPKPSPMLPQEAA
ncbi:hypothetical protein BDV26DRAFT_252194 [Aspergillus bertholletiae]|uniref:Uncharacterized protein n=1 Tax=Aspergillus bertholletiae TaxID=1226010 RepID=A0A5N7BNB4_9EURO|nr:hypothetical protein BDV26DRAFT_252194 [Aspergillus bertholletiae]